MTILAEKNNGTFITSDHANLAYCFLIAISMRKKESRHLYMLQEDVFINKWITNAIKNKLFPDILATELLLLQNISHKGGSSGHVKDVMLKFWTFMNDCVLKQNDLFRLSYACEELRYKGWVSKRLPLIDWCHCSLPVDINTFATIRENAKEMFDKDGEIYRPVKIKCSGNIHAAINIFEYYNFKYIKCVESPSSSEIQLELHSMNNPCYKKNQHQF